MAKKKAAVAPAAPAKRNDEKLRGTATLTSASSIFPPELEVTTGAVESASGLADAYKLIAPKPDPEIVIGLVGPIGCDLDPVVSAIQEVLRDRYSVDVVRLSQKIAEFFGVDYSNAPEHVRIRRLMRLGTLLRSESQRGDAVGLLGVEEIRRVREEVLDGNAAKHAYVLRSLKTPQEIQLLRNVYGRGFISISVYTPRHKRVSTLADRISKSLHGRRKGARALAEKLVEIDELEDQELGQDVQDAFPLADLFVYTHNIDKLKDQIRRFLSLVFGFRFFTPTREEEGMQLARSAALRSADMNRQVGAAITTDDGDLLALGCNDVPRTGGGLYWAGDKPDQRDFRRGVDSMSEHREQVIGEMLSRLQQAGLLKAPAGDIDELVVQLLAGNKKSVLKGTDAVSILEFGRSVHAEMAALTTAARLGVPVKGATLYCTTFPCHICARHIVASGIKRVVYVEPYPKSKAKQLHADSIAVDPDPPSADLVNFEPFEGIAPGKYFDLFEAGDARKDRSGRVPKWSIANGSPRFLRFIATYTEIEKVITGAVLPAIRKKKIKTPSEQQLDEDKETA